jgi:predicted RecA/RadA family phage recombinase
VNNYIQPGGTLTLAAPYNRTSGQGALVGSIFGVACTDVDSGDNGEFDVVGVFTLTKATGSAWTQGEKIHWNDSTKACSDDPTVGPLIGVATEAAASGDTTGVVRLNGTAPATSEGAQAAVADLTDNSGGATADGTIGAVTAPTALTDNSGGAAADGTIGVVTAPTALTHAVGTADNTVDDVGGSFNQTTLNNNFKELTTAQAANRLAIVALTDAIKEISTIQAVNRTAIIALTDAVKELSTKINALLAELRIVGVIAP